MRNRTGAWRPVRLDDVAIYTFMIPSPGCPVATIQHHRTLSRNKLNKSHERGLYRASTNIMNYYYVGGTLCFVLTALRMWSIGAADEDSLDRESNKEAINATFSNDAAQNNVTQSSTGTSDELLSKAVSEYDLISDIIKPTVAPATPHEDLLSPLIETLPDSASGDVKLLLPKGSVLPAVYSLDHGNLNEGSGKEDISGFVDQHHFEKSSGSSVDEKRAEKILEPPVLLIPEVLPEKEQESDEQEKILESNAKGEDVGDENSLLNPQDKSIEKEKLDASHDHLETFAEWREKQGLKTQRDKGYEVSKVKARPNSKRKKVNYASADCGAKVIAAHSDATNLGAMLNENKDVYMLSPCKSKIWFIVELCEKVQPDVIEIANYELFSSMPKSFDVYASSRSASRDWHLLGRFHARDERQVQGFPLEEKHYAKFIKVEMLSHFGSEHYCPISLFRVFGTSEVDELEESENSENDHDAAESDDDDTILPADPNETSTKESFIESAKDAVFGMVSKAVETLTKKSSQNITEDESPQEIRDAKTSKDVNVEDNPSRHVNMAENTTEFQATSETNEVNASIVVPLKDESEDDSSDLNHPKFSLCALDRRLVNNSCINFALSFFFQFIIVKKQCLFNRSVSRLGSFELVSTQRPDKVTFDGNLTPSSVPLQPWNSNSGSDVKFETNSRTAAGGDNDIVQPLLDVSTDDIDLLTSSKEQGNRFDKGELNNISPDASVTLAGSISDSLGHGSVKNVEIKPPRGETETIGEDQGKGSQDQEGVSMKGEDVDVLEFAGYENGEKEGRAIKILQSDVAPISSNNVSISSTEGALPDVDNGTMHMTAGILEPTEHRTSDEGSKDAIALQSETTTQSISGPTVDLSSYNGTVGVITDYVVPTTSTKIVPTPISFADLAKSDTEQQRQQLTQESNKEDIGSLESSKGLHIEPPFKVNTAKPASKCSSQEWSASVSTGAPGGTKESLLVKLKSRVRQLEANLTLSTQYLEQMSQKYRTAMEEQKKSFEKKVSALNHSVHKAENQISDMKKENQDLLKTSSRVQNELESVRKMIKLQNEQIAENYVFLVLVQIIVTMIIVWTCRSRITRSFHEPARFRRSSEPSMHFYHSGSSIMNATGGIHAATNSEECMKEELSPSKDSVGLLSVANKKKRQKRKPKLLDCTHILENAKPSSTIMSRTAGLLFSAGKGLLSGIAGALTPTYTKKEEVVTSRNTEALVGEFTAPFRHCVRRTKSSDLPIIIEAETDLPPQRPRSCDDLLLAKKSLQSGGTFQFYRRSGKQSG